MNSNYRKTRLHALFQLVKNLKNYTVELFNHDEENSLI